MPFKDKQTRNKYFRDRHQIRLEECKNQLGGRCSKCNSTTGLEFHHVDPSTKAFNIGSAAGRVTLEALKSELDKCVLLCKYCHNSLHQTSTHGTRSYYNEHHCRCEPCRKANREYARQRRGN